MGQVAEVGFDTLIMVRNNDTKMVPKWGHLMHTITLKNLPDDLYEKLKIQAQANFRSINSEIIACIAQGVSSHKVDPEAVIVRARLLREKTSSYKITDEELSEAKQTGRL